LGIGICHSAKVKGLLTNPNCLCTTGSIGILLSSSPNPAADELDEKTAERYPGTLAAQRPRQRAIDYAKGKGLQRVYGDVLIENGTMLQMCAELGCYLQDMGPEIRRVVLDFENIGGR
jgi:hypothetical protein